jgi:hypothetical protein
MDAHFVGPDQNQINPSTTKDISLSVMQFVELARGERAVQKPSHPFRVEEVKAEERYCMRCCEVRWFDVVIGVRGQGSGVRCEVLAMCRSCIEMEEK